MNRRDFLKSTAAAGAASVFFLPGDCPATVKPKPLRFIEKEDYSHLRPQEDLPQRILAYKEYEEAFFTDKRIVEGIHRYAESVEGLRPSFWFRDKSVEQELHDLYDYHHGRAIRGPKLIEVLGYSALYGDYFYELDGGNWWYLTKISPFLMYRIQTIHGKLVEYQKHPEGPDYRLVGKDNPQYTAVQGTYQAMSDPPIRWAGDRLCKVIHISPYHSYRYDPQFCHREIWPKWAGQWGYGRSLVPFLQKVGWHKDLKERARVTACMFCSRLAGSYLAQRGISSDGLQTSMIRC
jgi:hypothetical protein